MSRFSEAFEERKNMHLRSMTHTEPVQETQVCHQINFKKLFVISVLFNLFLLFMARDYFSFIGTDEYAIHNLRNNSNLSMHEDYLKRIRGSYCK